MIDYEYFVKNVHKIARDYVSEVCPEWPPEFILIRESEDLFKIEAYPFPHIFGAGEKFSNVRKSMIRALKFVKDILDDPILREATYLSIDTDIFSNSLKVEFKSTKGCFIEIEITLPQEYFDTSSIVKAVKLLSEVDERINKFWDSIKQLGRDVNESGYFKRSTFEKDLGILIEEVKYLQKVKQKAIELGIEVREKIQFVVGKRKSFPSFSVGWETTFRGVNIKVEISDDYFDVNLIKNLSTKEEITLDDLANLNLDYERMKKLPGLDERINKNIENPNLSDALLAHLANSL